MILFSLFSFSPTFTQDCCQGIRGNIDGDPSDVIDIADLVYIVNYSFGDSQEPPCFEESDVDASGTMDISDIVYMVNYSFDGGPAPLECPEPENLLFIDNFNGSLDQSPDPTKWDYDIGTNWGNSQLEYDTDLTSNVSMDGNGNLRIIAREQWYLGQPYTSARIVTRDLFEFTYGRVEARIKMPVGQGIWPAFWLLGVNMETVGWPQCGEIDIMEYLGHQPNTIYGTAHGPGYFASEGISQAYTLDEGQFDTDFHIFAIEWSENEIRWFVDDIVYHIVTPDDLEGNEWVFDHPFYIILNVAVGGTWPGAPDETTVFPQTMLVDYVKVYADTTIKTEPTVSAPIPSKDPSDVISIFCDTYTNNPVDTWSADWDMADVSNYSIGSDNVKQYDNLVYAGIEFISQTIDATAMTHFHMDVWTPDNTSAPSVFKIKLVDFGANGIWDDGGDDVEHEIILDENTMNTGEWVSIDLPLTNFVNLTTRNHIAQLIISGDPNTVFVDNIYFYDAGTPASPVVEAPLPQFNSTDVISIFSEVYNNITVDTWSAEWDMADVEDYIVNADSTKKYTNLVFAGIEFSSNTINALSMTHLYVNVWTPDNTSAPSVFKIKLVDFGANGVWDGGGDDVEHEVIIDESIMETGTWITLDIPLTEFTNLVTREHIAQLLISGDPNTVFIDNILLHK